MTNFALPSHVSKRWVVSVESSTGEVLSPADFEFFGAATAPGAGAVAMRSTPGESQTVLTLSPLGQTGTWHYSIFCRQKRTAVTWQVASGQISVTPSPCLAQPSLDPDPILLSAMLDPETLQVTVALGDSVAATAAAAQQAAQAAADAQTSQTAAAQSASEALAAQGSAQAAAADAQTSKTAAAQSASEALAAQGSAQTAAADAQTSQTAAAQSASDALAAQGTAQTAAADAQTSSKASADSASESIEAAEKAKAASATGAGQAARAEGFAEAAGVARAGAEAAQAEAEAARTDAQAAQVKAEEKAAEAEENAALLGDAALRGADNVFSGVNSFVGGLLLENNLPLLVMMAGAYRVPLAAALAETSADYIAKTPVVVPGEDWFVFMPRVANFDYSEKFNNSSVYKGRCFAVVPNLMNPCGAVEINAVVFGENKTCVLNPYRCNVLSMFFSGKKAHTFVNWGHNAFTQAPDIFIDAPYMTTCIYTVVSLRTVGRCRLRMPSLKQNFTLKIGAIKRDDVLYMLENLPDLKGEKKCTAALSCDPALEGDADFLTAVAAFYDSETGTGWDVGLTFQQNEQFNEDAAQVATYGLRRPRAVTVYAKRIPSEGGAWVDAAGARWDLMTAHWVADESDWRLFDDEAAAVEEWGLTEMTMEESMAANEISTENK